MGMCKPSGGKMSQTGRIGSLKKKEYQTQELIYLMKMENLSSKDGTDQMVELF